jgi:glycosyltransferase 2 family protein
MSKTLSNILKLVISLGIGVFIVWFTTSKLSTKDIADIKNVFSRADYKWLVIGPLIGMLSNVVRAERWKLLLNSVGYQPHRTNVINSVFVMYALNLVFPRLGEVTRCTLLYKTDCIPIDKSIGTMVLERMVDMVTILLIGALLMVFEYQRLFDLLNTTILAHYSGTVNQFTTGYMGIIVIVALITLSSAFFYFLYYMKDHHILGKVWRFLTGILHGLASISKLDNPILFIFYSLLIWVMYFMMLYTCFNGLPETANLGVWPGLACLFFGGFAFIISPGGLGAYPATIGAVLLLYKVAFTVGFGFGWMVWSLQTMAVIIFGVISFILVSRNFTVATKPSNS